MKVKEENEKADLKLNIQKTKIMASGPITSWEIDGEAVETVSDFIFLGSKITADGDCSHEIKRCLLLGRKVMTNLESILKSRDITLSTKVHLVKAMVFPVVTCGWKSWTIRKVECRRIDAFEPGEKTLESPLDCKETQPVHSKGDQSWVFIGRPDVEAETPILCPPDAKSWLIGKGPDAGKDRRQEERGTTEHEMVGWHHWLDGHGFGWTPGFGDGQGSLACCDAWGRRVGHDWATELSNASKGMKYLEINLNQELKDLHRVVDSEVGILGWYSSSLANLLSDPGQITQWSEAQPFQLQDGHKTSTSLPALWN